jgi:hypothetical protein
MFDFQPNETFEPSSSTKHWCLYTHKTEHSFAGVPLPGLFQTTHYEWQVAGFLAIFLLEGTATYWAYRMGVIITAILASIFIDLVLAVVAHAFQSPICRLRNELVYEEDEVASALRMQLKKFIRRQRAFYSLIALSAMFKFLWFFSVYSAFDATALFVFTCYTLGAVLHMNSTGYAIFTLIFARKIRGEHIEYIETNARSFCYKPDPLKHALGENSLVSVVVGKHEIKEEPGDGYWLSTSGVLTDAELREMIAKQHTADQRRTVAIEGTRSQIVILKQGPEGGVEQ